uniref:Uncharacterized protein n=1 Tax=Oryza barthii TaxID=65489 RepID=A0A0D3EPE3_9ORYZ
MAWRLRSSEVGAQAAPSVTWPGPCRRGSEGQRRRQADASHPATARRRRHGHTEETHGQARMAPTAAIPLLDETNTAVRFPGRFRAPCPGSSQFGDFGKIETD